MRKFLMTSFLLLTAVCALAQTWSVSGVVLNKADGKPVEYATIILESTAQWAVADAEGKFIIENIQTGKNIISISCLGYVTDTREISIARNIDNYKVYLNEDNLALDGAVVTAQEKDNSATTSRTIDKNALDHVQMMNVSDIAGLLPGGATANPVLTTEQQFDIRAGGTGATEKGSSSFGTAVEVDGVRLSNNATLESFEFGKVKGVSTNNIASSNIESVEVITGVPSVEYGDMTSGVVKINTRKGKTPYIVTMSTNPRTKQVSASKGFSLGETHKGAANGVLNANIEYTKAISDKMSPYTGYDRKQISLTYSNIFNKGVFSRTPLQLSAGITGNLGGMDSKADPDTFLDTFTSVKDNMLRGNISLNWLLSKSWITNLELNASIVYSDRQTRENKNYSNTASTAAIHGREEGYFVAQNYETDPDAAINLIPRGYWYNTMCVDDRPMNHKIALKANWARQWGKVNNKVKVGLDWTGDGNFGIGQYSEDMSTAPSFREYRYDEIPFMNNVAAYIEDNIMIQFGDSRLNIVAGLRNDNTIIKGSAYGTTSSLSPRFNAKYTAISPKGRRGKTVQELSFRASWGVAVKQPSFSVLFPTPTYRDVLTFMPTADSQGAYNPAYFISPKALEYNPDLKWQKNRQSEIGMEIDLAGYRISLAAYYNRTLDAYKINTSYVPFSYNYTSTQTLQNTCTIPADNRAYEIDRLTGQVTVHDKTGAHPAEVIPYVTKNGLDNYTYASNEENPITRYGVEWIVDFKEIRAIHTTFRFDGSFYGYRYLNGDIEQYAPYNTTGANGEPYGYIGFYYGGKDINNGMDTKSVNANVTVTTHIPKVRMIISVKLQASLLRYQRYLSGKSTGDARSKVIRDQSDLLSTTDESIYDGNNFTVLYPEFYSTAADPSVRRNYIEDLRWAKDNDPQMYVDLSKLAVSSSFVWFFGKDYISPYFSANISVTKEIGDIASISFYANNFFNNLKQIKSSKSDTYYSVSGDPFNNGRYAPGFFYGLSLRLKF